ncbi:hypothetical protein BS47DRAFT_1323685 [Hydnum rufescens UP504]|uniref:Rhodanese domain-containing protein n=1 Tax=Hydnum rufescens UP504 TaxID=1448309 RepID=A0A9P6E290_9AGAM|nr:hypothetical protein BS47DRAFT_1323685 [Hydnum rufescens UP504]
MEGLAFWLASEAITNSRKENGITYGVVSRQANATGEDELQSSVAWKIGQVMGKDARTMFIFSSWGYDTPQTASIFVFGSEMGRLPLILESLETRFGTRLKRASGPQSGWSGSLLAWENNDEQSLWDVLKEASTFTPTPGPHSSIPASLPPPRPPGSRTIYEILAEARARLHRLSPSEAYNESQHPDVLLVDIRPEAQRNEEGTIPGAWIIERNLLQWRFDPQSRARLDVADSYDRRIIVFCSRGSTSSLAAASLLDLGLSNATDIDGGFVAWKQAGLPTVPGAQSSSPLRELADLELEPPAADKTDLEDPCARCDHTGDNAIIHGAPLGVDLNRHVVHRDERGRPYTIRSLVLG